MHKILWKIGAVVAAVAASGLARKGVDKLHERFDPDIDPDDNVGADDAADGDAAADAADGESETGGEADDDEPEG